MVDVPAEERTRRGDRGDARPFRPTIKLPKRGLDPGRQPSRHEPPGGGPILELSIRPQVGQHLEQVSFFVPGKKTSRRPWIDGSTAWISSDTRRRVANVGFPSAFSSTMAAPYSA